MKLLIFTVGMNAPVAAPLLTAPLFRIGLADGTPLVNLRPLKTRASPLLRARAAIIINVLSLTARSFCDK